MNKPVNDTESHKVAPHPGVPGEGQFSGENVTAEETALIQQRQRARSKVMALGLISLCILFFLITIVKIGVWG